MSGLLPQGFQKSGPGCDPPGGRPEKGACGHTALHSSSQMQTLGLGWQRLPCPPQGLCLGRRAGPAPWSDYFTKKAQFALCHYGGSRVERDVIVSGARIWQMAMFLDHPLVFDRRGKGWLTLTWLGFGVWCMCTHVQCVHL